jgi:hypothetical protein
MAEACGATVEGVAQALPRGRLVSGAWHGGAGTQRGLTGRQWPCAPDIGANAASRVDAVIVHTDSHGAASGGGFPGMAQRLRLLAVNQQLAWMVSARPFQPNWQADGGPRESGRM